MSGWRFWILAASFIAACGGSSENASTRPSIGLRIEPLAANVSPGQQLHFRAIVTGTTDTSVAWSVSEGAYAGTVSLDGVYTAAQTPGTFHVVATSNVDPAVIAQAAVTVTTPLAVSVTILPDSVTVAPGSATNFVGTVDGTTDTGLTWSTDAGTIDQNGAWTAPQASGTCHIVAQSVADPTKKAVATATVLPGIITISIEPEQVNLLAGGPAFQFKAHVTGSSDTAVAWSVREPMGGATIDGAGIFKPPPWKGTFYVLAAAHADPTKTATAVANVADDMIDNGGPVAPITRTFAFWWGDSHAFPPDQRTTFEGMLSGLDGSAYLALGDQYMRGGHVRTSYGGSLFDASVPPSDPTDVIVADRVCNALDVNAITPKEGDLVFVITSNFPDAAQGNYCGLHSSTTCHGQSVLFAFTPNAVGSWCENTPDTCKSGLSNATLELLLIGTHELMESITDPFVSAWHDRNGYEIADRCGNPSCVPLLTGTFQLPDLYSNATHGCALH